MINISEFLVYPSFYSLVITGIILLIIFILCVKNYYSIFHLDSYKLITLLCVIAAAVGVHGVLHALFETRQKPNLDLSSFIVL